METLVSIIIPTYNRAHLIEETLDSIIGQTYSNWECIIIDDGSTDNTDGLVVNYCKKDSRIQYHLRPKNRVKGGNACRNYGFELSKGEYIKWFDSDDIMLPEHIAILVNTLQIEKVDFVVGDCVNFEEGRETNLKPFSFDKRQKEMNPFLFAINQIGWITDDFLGKREVVQNIRFNEKLYGGQEYNFFIRLLLQTRNGVFVNKIITRMRIHSQSLGVLNKADKLNYNGILARIKIFTLDDIFSYKHKPLNDWFLSSYAEISFNMALKRTIPPQLFKGFFYIVRIKNLTKGLIFLLSIFTGYFFKTGYKLNKYSRN